MNDTEITRIAAATNALRPDWPTQSIETLIRTKLAARARRDVAVALAWVACESETKTPARVLEAGPWWPAPNDATGRMDAEQLRRFYDTCCAVCSKPYAQCRQADQHVAAEQQHTYVSAAAHRASARPAARDEAASS